MLVARRRNEVAHEILSRNASSRVTRGSSASRAERPFTLRATSTVLESDQYGEIPEALRATERKRRSVRPAPRFISRHESTASQQVALIRPSTGPIEAPAGCGCRGLGRIPARLQAQQTPPLHQYHDWMTIDNAQ